MRSLHGIDLFDLDVDAVCITTNGFVKANGDAVMGRGCALEAASLFPLLPSIVGNFLKLRGNVVSELLVHNGTTLLTFPVKHDSGVCNGNNTVSHGKYAIGQTVPGFHLKADLKLIEQSAHQLLALANKRGWKTIALPRAGCGAGELSWDDVYPVLNSILDNRFMAVTK